MSIVFALTQIYPEEKVYRLLNEIKSLIVYPLYQAMMMLFFVFLFFLKRVEIEIEADNRTVPEILF